MAGISGYLNYWFYDTLMVENVSDTKYRKFSLATFATLSTIF